MINARTDLKDVIALTMGDPAGVGPEITAAAWHHLRHRGPVFVYIGDPAWLATLEVPVHAVTDWREIHDVFPVAIPCIPVELAEKPVFGQPSVANAAAIIQSIDWAVDLARRGDVRALVTNPISKAIVREGGFAFPGHTEYLAELCEAPGAEIMMLAAPGLRVVPVTGHVSLRQALGFLTRERIDHVVRQTWQALRSDFGIEQPRLALAGLNPHAGEGGHMGYEEQVTITPAAEKLRRDGINITLPLAPDTMFTPAARACYDAAICLYHDQALIPLKTLYMDEGVNITLGLDIVRTSPDHGTAFDIAGTGQASPNSLIAALFQAEEISAYRRGQHE